MFHGFSDDFDYSDFEKFKLTLYRACVILARRHVRKRPPLIPIQEDIAHEAYASVLNTVCNSKAFRRVPKDQIAKYLNRSIQNALMDACANLGRTGAVMSARRQRENKYQLAVHSLPETFDMTHSNELTTDVIREFMEDVLAFLPEDQRDFLTEWFTKNLPYVRTTGVNKQIIGFDKEIRRPFAKRYNLKLYEVKKIKAEIIKNFEEQLLARTSTSRYSKHAHNGKS